jgi:hypothetical protein
MCMQFNIFPLLLLPFSVVLLFSRGFVPNFMLFTEGLTLNGSAATDHDPLIRTYGVLVQHRAGLVTLRENPMKTLEQVLFGRAGLVAHSLLASESL